ncbi:MAG: hypothetical protein LBI58_00295 [Tannerellaceae bacterium]|jgi:glycosyltransferase involved in cell wall biosynthesis|nr:hypothetical protein [Tannerellaceae bacterium]
MDKTARDKIFFIYDVGPESRVEWVFSAFDRTDIRWIRMKHNDKNRIYRWRKILHFACYLEVAVRAIRRSSRGDVIVSWNFIAGACVGVLCRLLSRERVILSLNMISHAKRGAIVPMRRLIYNYAFAYPSFHLTVNSSATLSRYLAEYRLDGRRCFVLPDAYLPTYPEGSFDPSGSYIFCGGEAQRDWRTFWEAARRLPHCAFVGVGRRKFTPGNIAIPTNVTMYYDIPGDKFNSLLAGSALLAMPLLTSDTPAGLIVMHRSIFLSKPVIVTRNSSIENYLEDNKSAILLPVATAPADPTAADALAGAIERIITDKPWAETLTQQAKASIRKHSPQAYSQTLKTAITTATGHLV